MSSVYAYFDLDGTIIHGTTLVDFLGFYCARHPDEIDCASTFSRLRNIRDSGATREHLNKEYYGIYSGVMWDDLIADGNEWFLAQDSQTLFVRSIIDRVSYHRSQGHIPCIVSGSFMPCVAPIASYLGIDDVICTELELVSGRVTGTVTRQLIGKGKESEMLKHFYTHDVDREASYAYADDISDMYMLSLVGHPVAVGDWSDGHLSMLPDNHERLVD